MLLIWSGLKPLPPPPPDPSCSFDGSRKLACIWLTLFGSKFGIWAPPLLLPPPELLLEPLPLLLDPPPLELKYNGIINYRSYSVRAILLVSVERHRRVIQTHL